MYYPSLDMEHPNGFGYYGIRLYFVKSEKQKPFFFYGVLKKILIR